MTTPHGIEPEPMTRREREELAKVARLRARVARTQVTQREAELLADVEAQLAAEYKFDDRVWKEITAAARAAVQVADEQVAELCRQRGIPEEFRPSMNVSWYRRGENASKERRAELRKVAQSRIAATGKAARAAIEATEAQVLTELLAGGFTTAAAHDYLQTIPSAEALMPRMDIAELEGAKRPHHDPLPALDLLDY